LAAIRSSSTPNDIQALETEEADDAKDDYNEEEKDPKCDGYDRPHVQVAIFDSLCLAFEIPLTHILIVTGPWAVTPAITNFVQVNVISGATHKLVHLDLSHAETEIFILVRFVRTLRVEE